MAQTVSGSTANSQDQRRALDSANLGEATAGNRSIQFRLVQPLELATAAVKSAPKWRPGYNRLMPSNKAPKIAWTSKQRKTDRRIVANAKAEKRRFPGGWICLRSQWRRPILAATKMPRRGRNYSAEMTGCLREHSLAQFFSRMCPAGMADFSGTMMFTF